MKKVVALIAASGSLIFFSRWALTSGVAYSLRDIPPEKHAFALDVTTIREQWWLLGNGSMMLAVVLFLTAIFVYLYERRRSKQ